MVKIENLSVAFGGSEVVKNVSFTIKDGEILGVVGESGSGKSVTALTLMGLVSRNAEITSDISGADDLLKSYKAGRGTGRGNASAAYGAGKGRAEKESAGKLRVRGAFQSGKGL